MVLLFANPNQLSPSQVADAIQQFMSSDNDSYQQMNALRDWFNQQFPTFDFYLEDVWNDNVPGETHFEYILRSRHTLNETPVLAYDVYSNHQDAKGVWHLGDYQTTTIHTKAIQGIIDFMTANGAQWNP